MHLVFTCDGGFKKVGCIPGIASYAWVLWKDGRAVGSECGFVAWGLRTYSDMAEYGAIVAALRWVCRARLGGLARIEIHSDCQSVVDRLSQNRLGPRRHGILMLHRAALRSVAWLRRRGHTVKLVWVPRKRVSPADALCRKTYTRSLAQPRPSSVHLRHFLRRETGKTTVRWVPHGGPADRS